VLLLVHQPGDVNERALARFAAKAQRAVGLRGEVGVCITTSDELRRMNRQYRQKDEPTDVLSFEPLWGGANNAGDVAISGEIAAANAARLGHSTETELRILILHGLLHLAGYDHETDGGEMQAREAGLRCLLKLSVGLIERAHKDRDKRSASRARKSLASVSPAGRRR
jgi:probable rRNA maturation factor